MLVCVSFTHFAHGTADAARIRHSPRPLISRRETFAQTSGGSRRENEFSCLDQGVSAGIRLPNGGEVGDNFYLLLSNTCIDFLRSIFTVIDRTTKHRV